MIVVYSLFLFVCLLCDMRTPLCVYIMLCHQFPIHTQKRYTAQQQLLLFTHLYFTFLFLFFFSFTQMSFCYVEKRKEFMTWTAFFR